MIFTISGVMKRVLSTGLFIPVNKQALFLVAFEDLLFNSYHFIPTFGPNKKNNCCEIKFKHVNAVPNIQHGPSSVSWNFERAKKLLKENLNILGSPKKYRKNEMKNNVFEMSQVIDLVDESSSGKSTIVKTVDLTEEPEIIELNDTMSSLNKTLDQLEITLSDIETVAVEVIDMGESGKKRLRNQNNKTENEIQVICSTPASTTNRSKRKQTIAKRNSRKECDSEIEVLGSSSKQGKKRRNLSVGSNGNISVVIENNFTGSNNAPKKTDLTSLVNKVRVKSPARKKMKLQRETRKKEPKAVNVSSPAAKTLSDTVAKYYQQIESVMKKTKNTNKENTKKKIKSPRTRSRSPLKKLTNKNRKQAFNHRTFQESRNNDNKNIRLQPSRKLVSDTNVFNPNPYDVDKEGLRPIAIDGSNVAIGHGRGTFSALGLQICVNFFAKRGHKEVKVFLPKHRQDCFTDQQLGELRSKCDMVFTPSMTVNGVKKTSYDDRFIVQYAVEVGGVIVSTDNYRDLLRENPRWKDTIHNRLLMFTFVDDLLMFPVDPLGRSGPTLDQLLRF